jgi:hypothetical protein
MDDDDDMRSSEQRPSLTIKGAGTIPEFFQLSLQEWNEKRQKRGEPPVVISFVS